MLLKDKKNCEIFSKFLLDDLLPYNLIETRNDLKISYNNQSDSYQRIRTSERVATGGSSIELKTQEILSLITRDEPTNIHQSSESIWFPVFVRDTDNYSLYKQINKGYTNSTNRLGIDNFISFAPSFKSWSVLSGQPKMTVDWILNSADINFDPIYGLLFWAKKINIPSSNAQQFLELSSFPNGSVLQTNNSALGLSKRFLKVDDETVLDSSKDSSIFLNITYNQTNRNITSPNPNITFNNEQELVKISSLSGGARFKLYNPTLIETDANTGTGYILWIPDGDVYSFSDKVTNVVGRMLYQASDSYISPSLYSKYSEIYHILTLNEKRNLYSGRRLTHSKFLKKLCYILATSPLMDGVNHRLLLSNSISNIIQAYVYNPQFNNGFTNGIPVENEIVSLRNCLVSIFNELKRINGDSTSHYSNLSTNYITSKKDLFLKLINKYDVNLTMTQDSSLKYNNKLKYGSSIAINQAYKNYCNKNLTNTLVYNNQEFLFQDESNTLRVSSQLSEQETEIKINCNTNTTSIPLADIKRLTDFAIEGDLFLDLGTDVVIKTENEPATGSIVIEAKSQIYDNRSPSSFLWELVEGPCGKFTDRQKSSNEQVRYDYSTDYGDTKFFYSDIGRYVIKCTLRTVYGVISVKKIIFVLDKKDYYLAPNSAYSDTGKKLTAAQQFIVSQTIRRTTLRTDNVKCLCATFDKIAIDQKGIFCPSKTGFYVSVQNEIWNNDLTELEGDEKFKFTTGSTPENPVVFTDNTQLTLIFKPNNTTIKLTSISLQNIRNGSEECNNCVHIYKDLFVAADPVFGRRFKEPDMISLDRFDSNGNKIQTVDFDYYPISTRTAGPVKSYGGYNQSVVDNIGIHIPGHPIPSSNLPHITGHNLTEKEKICHQVDINYSGALEFEKGIFHPSSGWIMNTAPDSMVGHIRNKSSVLKFNPSSRKTLSFIGQGFANMKSSYVDEENIPNIYSSSITLEIDREVREFRPKEGQKADPKSLHDTNQKKELADHNVNHGYRSLDRGYQNEYSDEYGFSASFQSKIGTDCSNKTSCTYSIVHKGPKLLQIGEPAAGELKLQNTLADGFSIQDMEIKLNFLNYVNTKNLIIWIDMDLCQGEATRSAKNCVIKRPGGFTSTLDGDQAYAQGFKCARPGAVKDIFTDNDKLGQYLADLNVMNIPAEELNRVPVSVDPDDETQSAIGSSKLRLFLLNKEHIQNNQYNTSIVFSDHASKHNKSFDYTVVGSSIIDHQTFEKDTIYLQPTTFASGYADTESVLYTNIIKSNKLNLHNNSFQKFKNMSLFAGDPNAGDGYSSTTFTLNIAVLDESDDMRIYDNIKNSDILSSLKTSESKIGSNNIYNSLCSWELIINVTSEGKEFTDKDNLGMIRYGEDPSFLGYNFIYDFSSILPSQDKRYLIPAVNVNAPYTYINKNQCRYQDWDIMAKPNFKPIDFPYWAILYIVLNTGVVGGGTGTLVGVLSSIGDPSPGYAAIVDYFKQIRRQRVIDSMSAANDIAYYKGFGQPEKALLNVSKDGIVWYKLEASIFRYNNTPILDRIKYSFIKMKKNLFPQLSEFKFSVVSDWSKLIDKNLFVTKKINENISINDNFSINDSGSSLVGGQNISDGDIVELTAQQTVSENGLYIVKTNNNSCTLASFKNNIRYSNKILQYNSLYNDTLLDNIESKISDKKIIMVSSRVMFDVLSKNDSVLLFSKSAYEQVTDSSRDIAKRVINKGLVVIENKLYSVLELDSGLPDNNTPNTISFNTNDVVVIFKPENTQGQMDSDNLPINKWGLDNIDTNITPSVPELSLSTYGVGSYGNGSEDVYKYTLSNNYQENQLFKIKDLFNNKKNDTLKANKFIITSRNSSTQQIKVASDIRGFEYDPLELDLYTNLFNYNSIEEKTKEQEQQYAMLMTEIKKMKSSIMYIKSSELRNDILGNEESYDYGTIEIGNDYYIKDSIVYIPQNIIDILVNRVKFLSDKEQSSLSNLIGKTDQDSTRRILSEGNIADITAHLNALPSDPNNCYKEPLVSCHKKLTENCLKDKYIEKNNILYYLDKYTKKLNPGETYNGINFNRMYAAIDNYRHIKSSKNLSIISFQYDIRSNNFMSNKNTYYLGAGVGTLPTNNKISIDINERETDGLYWINIDPKQVCSVAEDATAKVLKKVTYQCFSSLGDTLIFDVDQVCPPVPVVLEINNGQKPDPDEEFSAQGNDYVYTIPEKIIQANKARYPTVTEWIEHRVEKEFLINSGTEYGYRDVYIKSIEIYDIAAKSTGGTQEPLKDYSDISNRVYSIFNLDNTNSIKVRFRNIPRKLKGVDPYYDKYIPNQDGVPIDSIYPSPGGRVFNAPAFWRCLDTKTLKYTEPTNYLKMQNEMIYRAFFGSVDGMEHKKTTLESLYPFEWIPYEYCTDCW